jgi:hypothetical protein
VRIAALAALVCLLGSVSASAQNFDEMAPGPPAEGLRLSDRSLVKESFRAGTTGLDVYAGPRVDLRALLKAANVGKDETPQSIHDKINAARQRLYPNEPMVLEVSPAKSVDTAASLVKAYTGWNYAGSWTAYWASEAATMFISDVLGAYNVYDCYPCGKWKLRGTVRTGGSFTRYNYGSYVYRGFSLIRGSGSRADFAMYFFR